MTAIVTRTDRLTIAQFALADTDFIIELVNSPGWLEFIGDRNIKGRHRRWTLHREQLASQLPSERFWSLQVGFTIIRNNGRHVWPSAAQRFTRT